MKRRITAAVTAAIMAATMLTLSSCNEVTETATDIAKAEITTAAPSTTTTATTTATTITSTATTTAITNKAQPVTQKAAATTVKNNSSSNNNTPAKTTKKAAATTKKAQSATTKAQTKQLTQADIDELTRIGIEYIKTLPYAYVDKENSCGFDCESYVYPQDSFEWAKNDMIEAIKYCYDDALIAGNKKIGMYPRFIWEGDGWTSRAEYILVSEITLIYK